MDALLQTLSLAQARLDAAGIGNVLIGGLAVAAYGRPRLTDDVDLKVEATHRDVPHLIGLLQPDFQPVENAVEHARTIGVLFLEGPGGVRLGLLLADLGFDEQAFRRARMVELVPGVHARLCSPEDLILYKMITTPSRDREDVRSVVVEQGVELDRDYVEQWLAMFEQALDDSTLDLAFQGICRDSAL